MSFQPRRSGRTAPPPNNQPVFSTNQAKPYNQNNQAQQQGFNQAQNQQKQFQNQAPLQQPPAPPLSLMQAMPPQQLNQQPIKQDVSATGKALQQMDGDEEGKKQRWKKGDSFAAGKVPLALKKKRMNQRLGKILTPKNALILLHEFKPGCTYKVQEQPGTNPPMFVAMVEHNSQILATGQGMSKAQAKNTAAENAIKTIVSQAMTQQKLQTPQESDNTDQEGDVSMEEENGDSKDPASALPWAGLASFAIYKMFTEWQNQGAEVPMTRQAVTKAKKKNAPKPPAVKKELPANAAELHPSVLLNTMRPGIVAVEVSRTPGPNPTVTMGYEVDGRMFTGLAGNKKDAKREAAKSVITALYGLQYPQPAAAATVTATA